MKKLLLVLCLLVFMISCKEDEPIVVKQFSLPVPSSTPTIDRSVLVSGGSFSVGYANGNIRSNRATLTWQRSGDANFLAYRIVRGSLLVRTITDAQTTSAIDSNLIQNTYYKYTIASLVQEGTHRYDTVTIKTPRFQTPFLSSQVLTDATVRLTWNRSAESATSYRLERRLSSNPSFAVLASVPDTTYLDQTVQNFNQYYYRIAAASPFETTATSSPILVSVFVPITEGFESGSIPSGWTTGGNVQWSITNVGPFAGTYCARSGVITHSQTSYIERTLSFTGTRTISFYYRVSSELTNDALRFTINGVLYGPARSGETGWLSYSTNYAGSGAVVLRWEYSKNASVSTGQDAVWIDNVVVQ